RFLRLLERGQGYGLWDTWLKDGPDAAIDRAVELQLLTQAQGQELKSVNLQTLDQIVVEETRGVNEDAGVELPPNPVWVRIWVRGPGPWGGGSRGSLPVVGPGIQPASPLTPEARAEIEAADVVLALVTDPVTHSLLVDLNSRTRSLHGCYQVGRDRRDAYTAMVEEILGEVRSGKRVCAAFYGHPGIFVQARPRAGAQARAEGYD